MDIAYNWMILAEYIEPAPLSWMGTGWIVVIVLLLTLPILLLIEPLFYSMLKFPKTLVFFTFFVNLFAILLAQILLLMDWLNFYGVLLINLIIIYLFIKKILWVGKLETKYQSLTIILTVFSVVFLVFYSYIYLQ